MSTNRIVIGLVCAWAVLMVVSFVHPFALMGNGDAFGFARLVTLLEWQGLALLPAVVALVLSLTHRERLALPVRVLGYLPTLGYVAEFGLYQLALMFR